MKSLPSEWADLYPFQVRSKALSCGFRMSYVDEGEGHPVVMVHGNPTWSFYYRNVILRLKGSCRCIAVDHIGCGLSDKPPGKDYSFNIDQRIRDLGELIDALDLESFDLIVHDWGGVIGLGAGLERLEKVRRVILLNTAAYVDSRIPASIALCRAPLLGKLIVKGFNGFAGPAVKMAMSRHSLSPEAKAGLLYPYRSWSDREAVYRFVKDIPMHVSHPSFNRLVEVENGLLKLRERDVTILWGGKDFCFNDHFLERWKRFLPEATAIRYPDAGHYILEDETEKVCEAIYQAVSYEGRNLDPET